MIIPSRGVFGIWGGVTGKYLYWLHYPPADYKTSSKQQITIPAHLTDGAKGKSLLHVLQGEVHSVFIAL